VEDVFLPLMKPSRSSASMAVKPVFSSRCSLCDQVSSVRLRLRVFARDEKSIVLAEEEDGDVVRFS
jgi:hypothetical protein